MTAFRIFETFKAFLILGLTSFGGPIAHIGYFRTDFVERKRWLTADEFADLVALCQFLPGPASSQLGFAIGLRRAGLMGGIAAFLGFTLPSAVAMILFGFGVLSFGGMNEGLMHGLKLAAVAVIAQAVWGMGKGYCAKAKPASVMAASTTLVLVWQTPFTQLAVISLGALLGMVLRLASNGSPAASSAISNGKAALAALVAFILLLIGLPLIAGAEPFAAIYRAGSFVFGGGHVVLPLLRSEFVTNGWLDDATFLAGYGAAQALPGPLFTFAGFLGTVMSPTPDGWLGGLLALLLVFLPGFLLLMAALPYWEKLKHQNVVRHALAGINAAVVGLLLAALYHPVATSSLTDGPSFAIALAAFVLLVFWELPPWIAVLFCAAVGGLMLG